MKKVLLSKEINSAGMTVLKGKVETIVLPEATAEAAKRCVVDVEGMILRTNIKVTREIIEAASVLKVISRTGAGVDNVDVAAATKQGIRVCNTPGINANSVAEQTVSFLLGLAKQLKMMDTAVQRGNWSIRNAEKTVDVEGKTIGLIGLGRIGTLVAKKCRLAFDMRVIGYDPNVERAKNITLCSTLEEVFEEADFVSIHVPYSEQTHHLVDARLLGIMKPDSHLINTSRGAVVDERALTDALQKGAIAGAGLDVFEEEPPSVDNPLLQLENVIATPHASALSRECEVKVAAAAAQAVIDVLEGKEPKNVYNKEQLGLK